MNNNSIYDNENMSYSVAFTKMKWTNTYKNRDDAEFFFNDA